MYPDDASAEGANARGASDSDEATVVRILSTPNAITLLQGAPGVVVQQSQQIDRLVKF